jgi:hypothetical protein
MDLRENIPTGIPIAIDTILFFKKIYILDVARNFFNKIIELH